MANYGTGKSGFNKALDKGTSPQLTEPDWDAIIFICDLIRSGEIKAKYAVDGIMKKISLDNQNSAKNALQILESIVKNCGPTVHSEVANLSFMEFMKNQSKLKTDSVKAKILELIQCWAFAFRDNSEYQVVTDTFNEMKNTGVSFPTLREADAMFTSEVPPQWKEEESCFACRTDFGMLTRRHHCRACGQSFCSKCSSKTSTIPKFGIEKEVRVCDACYAKLNKTKGGAEVTDDESGLPQEYLNSPLYKQSLTQSQNPTTGGKSKEEIEEEEQLQLALAISQSEAEAKDQEKRKRQTFMSLDATPPAGMGDDSSRTVVAQPTGPKIELDNDLMTPELQKYLNRNYWEQRQKETTPSPATSTAQTQPAQNSRSYEPVATTPSAPPPSQSEPLYSSINKYTDKNSLQTAPVERDAVPEESDADKEQFMKAMSSSIDVFVNRMNSDSVRGRSIINDSAVQTLFATLQNMHPQLLSYLQALEDKRSHYESLQDKLAQLRDARDALTSLRDEHAEKRRIEAEEKAKRKQIQMMQKLDVLRKQKQQVLDRQRLEAMQRLQQQQAEMAARIEMQKQQTQMRQMQLHGFPQELQTGYGQYNPMSTEYMHQYPPQQQQYQQTAVEQQQVFSNQQTSQYNAYQQQLPHQQLNQPQMQVPPSQQQMQIPLSQQQMQVLPAQISGQQPGLLNTMQQTYQSGLYQPSASQQSYGGYQQQTEGMTYNPYNMQGMAENLPPTSQPLHTYQTGVHQPQQYIGQPGISGMGGEMQQPGTNQLSSAPTPPYQQAPPPQNESQLISFD